MKSESVLTVLMYLFQYHMQDSCEVELSQERLIANLAEAGFSSRSVVSALQWLENLNHSQTATKPAAQSHNASTRVFDAHECEILSVECRDFILYLERERILNAMTREMLIDRVLELKSEVIDKSIIKWVALLILFNRQKQNPAALEKMEFYVFDHTPADKVH